MPECEEYLLVAKEYIGGNIYLQVMSEVSRSIEEIPPRRDIPDKLMRQREGAAPLQRSC